jgi:hypothetical protein
LGGVDILTILILPIHEQWEVFVSISFISILNFHCECLLLPYKSIERQKPFLGIILQCLWSKTKWVLPSWSVTWIGKGTDPDIKS